MPIAVGTIAAKDGGGNTIAGGLRAGDLSAGGDGSGPWALGQFLIDGKAGTNRLGIFAEDAAHADGDTGLQLLSVRTDTAAARAGTDGDYQPLITDASGRLHVNVGGTVSVQPAGSVAHDAVGTGVNPVLEGGFASAAAPSDVSADGDSVRGWRLRNGAAATVLTAAGALIGGDATNGLDVDVTRVTGGGVAHDGAGGSVNPLLVGGYASAAAPTDVSADADSVRAWFLRNGAQATVLTAAGALVGGDATNGLDVDVTRMIPGTGATALGKAEDAGHTSGDTGVMALAVRNDAGTALAGTDLDYIPLTTDNTGALRVTGGGGGTQYTEDAAAAADPVGNMLLSRRRDTPTASEVSADGDNIASIATSKGKIWTAAELRVGDSLISTGNGSADSGTIRVSVATDSQTQNVVTNADGVAVSGSQTATPTASYLYGFNGTSFDRLLVDANKNLRAVVAAGAASIGKAEDVASADADVGVPAMAVRKATPANTSGTDGDYEMLQMSAGRLWTSAVVEASESHLGEVGGNTILFSVTPTLDTSAYATGDVLFDRTVLTNFFRKNDGTGILQSIQVIDKDDNGVAIDFYIQTTNQTLGTANSAPSISDTNAEEILGPFSVAAADYKDLGGCKVAKISGLAQAIKSVSGARTLYISAVVNSGTPTFTASGMVLRIGALLD